MTKTKSTKRALLMSALALLMCVSMLIGSTFAWFTDSVTSGNNKIVAGNLDVDLLMADTNGSYVSIADKNGAIFGEGSLAQNNAQETLWEPGKTQIVYLAVANNGNLDLKYNIALHVTDGGLIGSLEYAIVDGAEYGDINVDDWAALKANAQTGDVVAGTTVAAPNGAIKAGEEKDYFALAVHMKEEAGNEYQGKDITIDITVLATQLASESDSFGDQYDKDAELPAVETVIDRGEVNNISWTLTDAGTLAISGEGVISKGDIASLTSTIGSQITSVKVGPAFTEIGEEAFRGLNIVAVSFENDSNLKKIGVNAFRDCVALEMVEIPASVEEIYTKAFQGCTSLETVSFEANSNLRALGIGEDNGKNVFNNCKSLKTVVLPDSVQTIGVACFANCTNLETVVLGDNVYSIGASAFENSGLTSFEIPTALTVIPSNMLKNTKITTIAVGDQVTTVNPGAFENCTELKSAYVGTGVTTIKEGTFAGCTSLETVIFANVTDLDCWAFMNSTNLKVVVINAANNLTLGYNTHTTGEKANWYGNAYYSATGNVITYVASAMDGAYGAQFENCLLGHGWNDGTADGTDILAYTNGGTFANGTTFADGTLATPTKAGYEFGGWYAESDFSGTAVTTAVAGQIYYAKWIAK